MIDRALLLPERRPGRVLLVLGLVFALAYGTSLVVWPKRDGRIVVGDAVHYYVYLRSAVFDGDLRFQNEYIRLYGLKRETPEVDWIYTPSPTGHVRNLMPVGPAIVWSPLYLLVAAAVAGLGVVGLDYPLDGMGRLFQATAGFSGIAAATAGAWLAFRAAVPLFGRRAAIWATLGLWLGSSALYYSLVSPTYSHAVSMLATGLFAVAWVQPGGRTGLGRYARLGALAGFAALMRWQDAVLLVLPGLEALQAAWRDERALQWRLVHLAGRVGVAAGCALVIFTPQLLVWQTLYGRPLLVPQGEAFLRWTDPALIAVLVSDRHGLFSWTPIVALAVAGLLPLWRRHADLAFGAAVVLGLSWYINAAVADWWAGEAFGARRFVSGFPFFVLGFAALLQRWDARPRRIAGVVAVAVGLNLLLLFQYQLFMKGWRDLAPYPRGFRGLWVERFLVPFRALQRLLGA